MKRLSFALIAVISFTGCSKKTTVSPNVLITGTWYISKVTGNDYKNGIFVSSWNRTENHGDYMRFNSDGTGSNLIDGISVDYSYIITKTTLTLYNPSDASDVSNLNIIKLDSNNLVIKSTVTNSATNESETEETEFVR